MWVFSVWGAGCHDGWGSTCGTCLWGICSWFGFFFFVMVLRGCMLVLVVKTRGFFGSFVCFLARGCRGEMHVCLGGFLRRWGAFNCGFRVWVLPIGVLAMRGAELR